MAIPQGGFTVAGAGIGGGGGAFSYEPSLVRKPHYYAGTFFIDTGYDDPVLWTSGVDAAEVYGARVYATGTTASPAEAAGTYLGKWHIAATPVWQAKQWQTPHANVQTQRRVLIQCQCFLLEPVAYSLNGHYQRMESVDWSLYRV